MRDVPFLNRLAQDLGEPVPALLRRWQHQRVPSPYLPLVVKADVSKDTIAAIETEIAPLPGIAIEARIRRRYPFGGVSAQVWGYTGEADARELGRNAALVPGDSLGKSGLERGYDPELRGADGSEFVEVDANGRPHALPDGELEGWLARAEPRAGETLQLTLDMRLEAAAAESLERRGFSGAVVVLDARSGEVLALVSEPSYDPDPLSAGQLSGETWTRLARDSGHALRDRAVQDIYPPGSTFKPFLAIAALADGTIRPDETTECTGSARFGRRLFHCWHRHGRVDLVQAIQKSYDVFFYGLGLKVGAERIAHYAREFGLGERSGIDLPGEQKGLVPSAAWKQQIFHDGWREGDTVSVAIGQGYLAVTPLQMAAAFAAIGNGGMLYRPWLVKRVLSPSGSTLRESLPSLRRRIDLPAGVLSTVREGLRRVVNEPGGTGSVVRSSRVEIAGKTGTAQVRQFSDMSRVDCASLPYEQRHHAWFVGYAPARDPQVAVAVITEHACHGAASPVARDVFQAYFAAQAEPDTPVDR